MALKKATFPFTARYALQFYLNRPRAGLNMDMIEKGLEFYNKLSLAYVREWVRGHSDADGNLTFSDVLAAEQGENGIKPVTVRIDESYLTWLRDQLAKHDWNAIPLPDGRTAIISTAVELQVCVGRLGKAINEAISGKDVDETELAPAT